MYNQIRNIHLLLGLSAAPVILIYAVSAVQMAHRFPIKPKIVTQDLTLQRGLGARPLGQEFMDHYGYRGDLSTAKAMGNLIDITISRPGANYAVSYDPRTGQATIRCQKLPFMGLLNRLHHLHGFEHSSAVMNVWGAILAWISVTLIALGATGIYMWFRFYRERVVGVILLATNLCVSIALLMMLRR